MRPRTVRVRVEELEFVAWKEAAQKAGLSLSAWLRDIAARDVEAQTELGWFAEAQRVMDSRARRAIGDRAEMIRRNWLSAPIIPPESPLERQLRAFTKWVHSMPPPWASEPPFK